MRGDSIIARGVWLFNREASHIVRLAVCLDSLREWWKGPVMLLSEGVTHPCLLKLAARYGVSIIRQPIGDVNVLVGKLRSLRLSRFESTLYMDTDTMILGPVDEGFLPNDYKGFGAVKMPERGCRYRRYRGRLKNEFTAVMSQSQLNTALSSKDYANTGVLAFRRPNMNVFIEWDRWALSAVAHGNRRAADETAFNALLFSQGLVRHLPSHMNVLLNVKPEDGKVSIAHYAAGGHVKDDPLALMWRDRLRSLLDGKGPLTRSEFKPLLGGQLENVLRRGD